MKQYMILLLAIGIVLAGPGCSSAIEEADSPEGVLSEDTTMDATPAQVGTASELVGTTWSVDTFVLDFHEDGEVHVSGEGVPIPGGVRGSYSVHDGIVEVSAAGQTHRGRWDGETLEMSGVQGERH